MPFFHEENHFSLEKFDLIRQRIMYSDKCGNQKNFFACDQAF